MTLTRRLLLGSSAASLAACTVTTTGATLDVMTLMTDGQAIVAALGQLLAAPGFALLLGPAGAVASAALAGASSALVQLHEAIGPTMTLTIDTASAQQIISTLLADASRVLSAVSVVKSLPSEVQAYIAAAQTLIPMLALAAQLPVPQTAAPGIKLTRQQAIAIAARP